MDPEHIKGTLWLTEDGHRCQKACKEATTYGTNRNGTFYTSKQNDVINALFGEGLHALAQESRRKPADSANRTSANTVAQDVIEVEYSECKLQISQKSTTRWFAARNNRVRGLVQESPGKAHATPVRAHKSQQFTVCQHNTICQASHPSRRSLHETVRSLSCVSQSHSDQTLVTHAAAGFSAGHIEAVKNCMML